MRIFDRKFGERFLAGVPAEPGVYRLYDAAGGLIYVGKARNLRRRLAQYRMTHRTKKDRKRRALVKAAERIEWHVCASELEASLTEVGLIQTLRPRRNIAAAFSFMYPFIGIKQDGLETRFCLTTSPEAFAAFALHGAFRSREITGEGFFALMRLLRLVAHPATRRARERARVPRYSHVYTFRRFPADWPEMWRALLRGASRAGLEELSLRLLDHAGARIRGAAIETDLRAVQRFFDAEASTLAAAIAATGYVGYPVPQRDRDALFLRYRNVACPSVAT
ncbi:MAG TPA: nucleotide excision repair endonuclease [Methylomirabilota bacterium]|nr:nucleotide excision repair endonuclease [Methylomirabilota bacterium]